MLRLEHGERVLGWRDDLTCWMRYRPDSLLRRPVARLLLLHESWRLCRAVRKRRRMRCLHLHGGLLLLLLILGRGSGNSWTHACWCGGGGGWLLSSVGPSDVSKLRSLGNRDPVHVPVKRLLVYTGPGSSHARGGTLV